MRNMTLRTLTGTTTPGQTRPRRNGKEGIFHILQIFRITQSAGAEKYADCISVRPWPPRYILPRPVIWFADVTTSRVLFYLLHGVFSVDSVSEKKKKKKNALPYVVPKCKGNYKNGPKGHCFSFPKSKHLFDKWKHAIKRENFTKSI